MVNPKQLVKFVAIVVILVCAALAKQVSSAGGGCKLVDQEPRNEPQQIHFQGGKLIFNASLAFREQSGRWQKFVQLKSSGLATLIKPNANWLFVYANFDCANVIFRIQNRHKLSAHLDYSATSSEGESCETSQLLMSNLETKCTTSAYCGALCPLGPDNYAPLLAVRDIKLELDAN